ncbi:hypothetical protein D3C81_1523570 [compost metagenome]
MLHNITCNCGWVDPYLLRSDDHRPSIQEGTSQIARKYVKGVTRQLQQLHFEIAQAVIITEAPARIYKVAMLNHDTFGIPGRS